MYSLSSFIISISYTHLHTQEMEVNRKRLQVITSKELLAERQKKLEICLKLLSRVREGQEAQQREIQSLEEQLKKVEMLAAQYEAELSEESIRMGKVVIVLYFMYVGIALLYMYVNMTRHAHTPQAQIYSWKIHSCRNTTDSNRRCPSSAPLISRGLGTSHGSTSYT